MEAFYKMMKNEQARAFYGPKHVFAACDADAIEVLLISDKLFRANKVSERKKERITARLVYKLGILFLFYPILTHNLFKFVGNL